MSDKTSLEEIRKQWEGNSVVFAERIPRPAEGGWRENVLVVLKNKDGKTYQCHRYFQAGDPDNWVVSVDGDRVSAETVIKWLCKPSARTCRPSDEDEE